MNVDLVAWAVTAVLLLPAVWLAAERSSLLVDYAIFLYVFNRGIRRVVDWSQGEFNPFSPVVLTPLVVTFFLLLPLFYRFRSLGSTSKKIFILFLVALGYGTLVGLARNGISAVYGASEFFGPVALMGFTATAPVDTQTADRWMKSAGWITIAACLYGWFQYLTIPPWDAFWVQQVGFVGYLGKLIPTQMTVFSTFAERGPCAGFLALSVIPIIVSRRWRVFLGWPEVLLILSTIILTMARSGLILVAVGVLVHPFVNGGKAALSIILLIAVVAVVGTLGLNSMPNSDRINQRLSTMRNMKEDGSYQGRVNIANEGAKLVISNPAGFGMGSSGVGGRIESGSASKSEAVVGDSGYLELLASFGIPGGVCIAVAFFLLWRHLSLSSKFGLTDDYLGLARTFLFVLLISMFAGNFFSGLSVMWIAFGRALSPMMWDKVQIFSGERRFEVPITAPV
jgi:putative inorganic carbon (hco3(-)) transporter